MKDKYILKENSSIIFETPDDDRYWFGYYNYCPVSKDGDKVLCHRWHSDGEERNFSQYDTIEVGWFYINDKYKVWHGVGKTHACNWQQGAMSQWIIYQNIERIIFNDADNEKYISKIVDLDGKIVKVLSMAIYGINKQKQFSITINFERAYWCRAYHYEYIRNNDLNCNITPVDGVYKMDLISGKTKKIIDIDTIINTDYRDYFKNAKHWVEHIMLNPSGDKFSFYHRFDDGNGYKTRCFIADTDGKILCCLNNWGGTSWSHLGWINDDEFVIFGVRRKTLGSVYEKVASPNSKMGEIIRKIYRKIVAPFVSPQMHNKLAASSHYEIYNCNGDSLGCYEKGKLVNDGHPSFTKDGKYMLTDTYADEDGYRNLLIYNVDKNKVYSVGKFYSPFNECAYRSDLHPRFDNTENFVVVDSAHSEKHGLVIIKIDWQHIKS